MDLRMSSSSSDLWDTIASIREEDYDDVPEHVLRRIVEVEREHLEDEATAVRMIRSCVESYLEEVEHA